MFRIFTAVIIMMAGAAWAGEKPRISLVDFKGPKAEAAKKALSKKLCKTFKCVKPGSDSEVAVDAVVTAQLTAKKATLSVYFSEDEEPVTREVKLKGGKLPATAVKAVTSAVREAVASGMDPDEAMASLTGSP